MKRKRFIKKRRTAFAVRRRRFLRRGAGKLSIPKTSMTVGSTRTVQKYFLTGYYGHDTNYVGGWYFVNLKSGITVYYTPSGSNGTPNQGPSTSFTFGSSRLSVSPPGLISLASLLHSGASQESGFRENIAKYKYFRIAGVKTKVSSIFTNPGGTYTDANPPVVIPVVASMLSNIPPLFINCIDNAGIRINSGGLTMGAIDTAGTLAADGPWGIPQRSLGSLKYIAVNENFRTDVQKFFKFGTWCMPTQFAAGEVAGVNNITVGGLGHWIPTLCYAEGDPSISYVPYVNGAVVYGYFPVFGLGGTVANTNYQNYFSPMCQLEIDVYVDLMGRYDLMDTFSQ